MSNTQRLVFATSSAFFLAISSPAQIVSASPNVQACATFTREGLSLQATVTPHAVEIEVGSGNNPVTLMLPAGSTPRSTAEALRGCNLVLNRAQDEAAIAIPSENTPGSLVIARLNLKDLSGSKPIRFDPPAPLQTYYQGRYRNGFRLVGYREDSSELFLVTWDNRATLVKANGDAVEIPTNLPAGMFPRILINAADNRFWEPCYYENPKIFGQPAPCSMTATSLLGSPSKGPEIKSPLLTHQKGVLQWSTTFGLDSGSTLVIGGYPASGITYSHFVWIANLVDGSLWQMKLLSGWNDRMTGEAVLSPDSSVLAFHIVMADDLFDFGHRIVIADLKTRKQIARVSLRQKRYPLGFAIDHRDLKTILLVNWGDGWERKEFPTK